MCRVINTFLENLSDKSGYNYDFLCDRFAEMVNDGECDMAYFEGVTMEHDW